MGQIQLAGSNSFKDDLKIVFLWIFKLSSQEISLVWWLGAILHESSHCMSVTGGNICTGSLIERSDPCRLNKLKGVYRIHQRFASHYLKNMIIR